MTPTGSRPARLHGAVVTERFASEAEYCLYLMHRRAYEDARTLSGGKRVLDLGCNVGYGTELLAERAVTVVGLDMSPGVIDVARRRVRAPNASFQLLEGARLPFPDGAFDLLVSFQVIEHVPEPGGYLDEIRRVLAPGGVALFTTPNAAVRLDPGMPPWNVDHVREFTARELESLLRGRFSKVEIRGLFASEPLHGVELARCARARERARHRVRAYLSRRVRLALGPDRVERVRALATRVRRGTRPPPDLSRYSIDDFFYRTDGLDGALDLMAVCETS